METSLKNKFKWFILCFVFNLFLFSVHAGEIPSPGGVDIPVIVNVFGSTDTSNLNDIITTANGLLGQANIRLVGYWVNYGIEIGNGDGRLTAAEHEDVMIGSLFEMMPPYGPGKGIKINIADDILVEEPQLTSWSDDFLPIVYLESSVPPEQMGHNLAHQIGFGLGLPDSEDTGNLMFHDGQGTSLNQGQIDVMLPAARKIGCEVSDLATGFAPDILPWLPPGALYNPVGRAFIADPTGDVVFTDFTNPDVLFDGGPDAVLARILVDRPDSSGTIDIELVALDLISANGDTFVDIGFALNGAGPPAPGDILAPNIFDLSDTIVGLNIPGSNSSLEPSAGMIDVHGGGEFTFLPDVVPNFFVDEQTGFSRVEASVPVEVFNGFTPHPLEDILLDGHPINVFVNVDIFSFNSETFSSTFQQDFLEGGTLRLDPPPLPVLPPFSRVPQTITPSSPGFEIRSLKPADIAEFQRIVDEMTGGERIDLLDDLLDGTIPSVDEGMRVDPFVNLLDSGDPGFFNADNGHQDRSFPGIDPDAFPPSDPAGGDDDDYIGTEIRTFIDLQKGLNAFSGSTPGGVIFLISDQVIFTDGFESGDTSAWGPQSVGSKKFRKIDRGVSLLANGDDGNTLLTDRNFAFVVEEPGLYPLTVRSLSGRGGASLELHEVLPDGTRILLGDVANGGSPVFVPEEGDVPPGLPKPPDAGENGLPEGFEAGMFNLPPWSLSGDEDWFVSSEEAKSGTNSAQAGPITDGGSTSLILDADFEAGEITFWLKVSSEVVFDVLSFSIDGVVKDEWDGQVDWKQVSFPVGNGPHTLKWSYEKDSSASRGQDTAWIDDIAFNPLP